MNQIGIVVALPSELRTLTKIPIVTGGWKRISEYCLISVSGIGRVQASNAARLLLDNSADALISWGCAGALDQNLQAGDLMVPEVVISSDGSRYQARVDWHLRVKELALARVRQVNTAPIVEGDKIVADSGEKKALARCFNASGVDMESAAIAKVADQQGVPFLAIRAIADPGNMPIPLAVSRAIDERGRIKLSRLILHVLANPGQIPKLVRLGNQFRAAQCTLSEMAVLLDRCPPSTLSSSK